jgi:cobalt/nickel transport system permease protein
MHLGNGSITPECGLIALGISATAAGMAWRSLQKESITRDRALSAGALGSLIFSLQMMNFDVAQLGSAHLIGGVLLSWLLGTPLGLLTMAVVLSVQAILLGDGGIMSLGANIINMAILPAVTVAMLRKVIGDRPNLSQSVATIFMASVLYVIAAACFIVVEVALFRSHAELQGLGFFGGKMLLTHAVFGVIEGGLTVGLALLLANGSQLSSESHGARLNMSVINRRPLAIAGAACLITLLCLPTLGLVSLGSDSYTLAVEQANQAGLAIGHIESIHQMTGLAAMMQTGQDVIASVLDQFPSVAVLAGTALAGVLVWGLGVCLSRHRERSACIALLGLKNE